MKLRFSIRDLLWLTLVVGMAVGWWIDRSQVAAQAREAYAREEKIREMVGRLDTILAAQMKANKQQQSP